MDEYIGIPYKRNGRDRDGLDCYGLVYLVEKEMFGNQLPILNNIYDGNNVAELIAEHQPLLSGEQVLTPEDGDVVLFFHQGKPIHIGVYWQRGIIHATEHRGVIYERLNSTYLKRFQKKEYYRV